MHGDHDTGLYLIYYTHCGLCIYCKKSSDRNHKYVHAPYQLKLIILKLILAEISHVNNRNTFSFDQIHGIYASFLALLIIMKTLDPGDLNAFHLIFARAIRQEKIPFQRSYVVVVFVLMRDQHHISL